MRHSVHFVLLCGLAIRKMAWTGLNKTSTIILAYHAMHSCILRKHKIALGYSIITSAYTNLNYKVFSLKLKLTTCILWQHWIFIILANCLSQMIGWLDCSVSHVYLNYMLGFGNCILVDTVLILLIKKS